MEQSLLEQLQQRLKYDLTPLQEWKTTTGEMGVYQSNGFCELAIASSGMVVLRTYRNSESALEDARIIAAFAEAHLNSFCKCYTDSGIDPMLHLEIEPSTRAYLPTL